MVRRLPGEFMQSRAFPPCSFTAFRSSPASFSAQRRSKFPDSGRRVELSAYPVIYPIMVRARRGARCSCRAPEPRARLGATETTSRSRIGSPRSRGCGSRFGDGWPSRRPGDRKTPTRLPKLCLLGGAADVRRRCLPSVGHGRYGSPRLPRQLCENERFACARVAQADNSVIRVSESLP